MVKLKDSGVVFTEEPVRGYWLDGVKLEGITGMIGNQLFPDKYSSIPRYILDKAAALGIEVHDSCYLYNRFGETTTPESEWYKRIWEENEFEFINNEYLVTNGKSHATAIDVVFLNKKHEICIGDIKRTYELDKEYVSWQLSLNKLFFEMVNPDLKVQHMYVFWMRNNGELHKLDEIDDNHLHDLIEAENSGQVYINPNLPKADLSEKAALLIESIAKIKEEISQLEKKRDEFDDKIKQLFKETGMDRWETDSFTFYKVKEHERENFEKARFKSENPELYNKYVGKPTIVEEQIKYRPKK